MKLPNSPKSFFELLSSHRDTFDKIYSKVTTPLHKGKYLHWEEVRFKSPPEGLSVEEYWLGLKLRRDSLLQKLPLQDARGKQFAFLQPDPIPKMLHEIDMGAGGRIALGSSSLVDQIRNPHTKDRYYLSSLLEEALTSSQIEGAVATRERAKEIVRSGRRPSNKGERMVLNNFLTMKRIGELRHEPLSPELVFEIHRRITEGTLDNPACAGRFRSASEEVDVGNEVDGTIYHIPPPANELPRRMQQLCDFANGKETGGFVHPVLVAIILHFWLAYDHPFVDGNGRTARALFYWAMLRNGYWLFEFVSISQMIKKNRPAYYKAFLFTETDENDLTYFILYHLHIIQKAINALGSYIEKKTAALDSIDVELRGTHHFNHRQRALIAHAVRHPSQIYTIESHKAAHNVVHQTARTDLFGLAELGLLSATRQGRRWHFIPVKELAEKLHRLADSRER